MAEKIISEIEMEDGIEMLPSTMKDKILKFANDKKPRHYPPNQMYVTELVGCPRKAFFNRTLGRKKVNLQSAWYFWRGDLLDKVFSDTMEISQNRVTYPFHTKDGIIRISGYYDFVDNDGYITDLKTIKSLYYLRKDKAPKYENLMQVVFYGFCEAQEKVRLLYVDISNGEVLRFTIPVKENLYIMREFEKRAKSLYDALIKFDGTLAMKGSGWQCKRCEYKEECKILEESKKKKKVKK